MPSPLMIGSDHGILILISINSRGKKFVLYHVEFPMVKSRRIVRRARPGMSAARVLPIVARGIMSRYRSGGSGTATTSSRKRTEMAPLTNQKDVRVTYRKRRMRRGRKKRYVRQLKRFRSNMLKSLPARVYTAVFGQSVTWVDNTSRYFGAFMGLCANNFYDNNVGELFNAITAGSAADQKMEAGKLRMDHMSLSVVIRNTSNVTGGESGVVDLDIWKVMFIRDVPLDAWVSANAVESFMVSEKNRMRQPQGMDFEGTNTGAAITTLIQNTGGSSTTQVVGDTLWNNSPFLKYVKIMKQWKVQLGVGEVCHFNMRTTANKMIPRTDCFGTSALAAKRYFTQGYIFNANGRLNISDPNYFEDGSLVVEQYVRYNSKVVPGGAPTLVYDPPFS